MDNGCETYHALGALSRVCSQYRPPREHPYSISVSVAISVQGPCSHLAFALRRKENARVRSRVCARVFTLVAERVERSTLFRRARTPPAPRLISAAEPA